MKAVLEFTLPEESDEHMLALRAGAIHTVLVDLDNWLRGIEKYCDSSLVKVEDVRMKLVELSNRYGVDI